MLFLRNIFVIERNRGGIRDFFIYLASTLYFKYFIAALSLFTIILYTISSIVCIFSEGKNHDKINSGYLSEFILQHSGDARILDNESLGTKLAYNIKDNNYTEYITRHVEENLRNTTNQYLQNESMLNLNGLEGFHSQEESNGNFFDIEKIISDLQLTKEKRVAVIAKELGIDWKKEKREYAQLAGIEGNYVGSLDQNQRIRNYLIVNAQEIYKEKHGWNEWDTLDLVPQQSKEIKLNSEIITGEVTYNNVKLKVTAPIGSFPEGSVLKIKTLGDDDSLTKLDITLKEVQLLAQVDKVEFDAPMASFDISFYAANDTEFVNELQPVDGKVISVVFDYADNDKFKNPNDKGFLAIYHMEENDKTATANLVSIKNIKDIKENHIDTTKNTKSDSINIYANELSVYILTIVSEWDEYVEPNDKNLIFDTGIGEIVMNDNIILSSPCMIDNSGNCIYTGKILSKENSIMLPDVFSTGYNFGGWYYKNNLLGYAGSRINILFDNNYTGEESILDNGYNNITYACLYTEQSGGNVCQIISTLEQDGKLSSNGYILQYQDSNKNVDNDIYARSEEDIQKYGQELFDAYNWAMSNGITTIDDINKAKLNTEITREELAKMISVFMSNFMGKEPIITGNVDYQDVNPSSNLASYIQLAYQYQIMGINADGSPLENFDPQKPVSRGEFATVLSRILFGNSYNQDGDNYYESHIKALNNANILNNTNPDVNEWRGWIITMLYRSQSTIQNNRLS